jgi:amino acid adenylation domain-containing protein
MLADAGAALLVTRDRRCGGKHPHGDGKTLCLNCKWHEVSRESTGSLSALASADDLAYVIYTSGSSGAPRGAMIAHRSVCNVLYWLQDNYPLTAEDAIVQAIPFAFDGAVCDFYWPFLAGARIVLLRQDGQNDPHYIAQTISQQRGSTIVLVPSILSGLVDRPEDQGLGVLRRIFCGGETLPPALARRSFECVGPTVDIVNLYGPTETTVFVSAWRCEPDNSYDSVPIGRPIANTQLHVLNENMAPLPPGEIGELFVGGIGLARGYLNRQALTAERFVPNPFGEAGTRLYRTGDFARHLPNGALEHLGRVDSQVKLRGYRIELGEIEAALNKHGDVREAVAILRRDQPNNSKLVAYVVARGEEELSPDSLRRMLRESLPEYMVPSSIVILNSFPLTPNGKIDRGALPAPAADPLDAEYIPPQTSLEEVLTIILAEVLCIDRVGVHDHFFRLGLNSLQAAQIAQRSSDALGTNVSVGNVFAHCTVASLIEALASDRSERARLERNAELLLRLAALTEDDAELHAE